MANAVGLGWGAEVDVFAGGVGGSVGCVGGGCGRFDFKPVELDLLVKHSFYWVALDCCTYVGGLSEARSSARSGGSSSNRKACCGAVWVKRMLWADCVDIFDFNVISG